MEEQLAIEKCLRSFIIKAIHAIAQARSGMLIQTSCVSHVGPRNNMMLNIEEDPDVSATIKEALDSAFSVRLDEVISLEIISNQGGPKGTTSLEIWKFHLTASQPRASSDPSHLTVTSDLRASRLFEKLGALLKSIVCYSRLLPAYKLSRKLRLGYAVTRFQDDPRALALHQSRLGKDSKLDRIASLSPGLALNTPDRVPVNLVVSVHYRLDANSSVPLPSPKLDLLPNQTPIKKVMEEDIRRIKLSEQRRRVKPVFAEADEDDDDEEEAMQGSYLHEEIYEDLDLRGDSEGGLSESDEDSENFSSSSEGEEHHHHHHHHHRAHAEEEKQLDDEMNVPLPLPFSNLAGSTGWSKLFIQMRDKTELDLFKAPVQGKCAKGATCDFNLELETHEKGLKDCDDFLVDFCQLAPYTVMNAPGPSQQAHGPVTTAPSGTPGGREL